MPVLLQSSPSAKMEQLKSAETSNGFQSEKFLMKEANHVKDSLTYENGHVQHINTDDLQTLTAIQEFYRGTSIFITGATGFMGKTLLEKLLRSCPGIETVYVMVRAKKGKDVNQRVEELCNDPVFSLIAKEDPKFHHKIVPVIGDCSQPYLGLNEQDKEKLMANVNIVFHAAATVRFDEKIRIAMAINVYATRDLLEMSKKMANLKAFVYVSTAYSHATSKHVDERYYESRDMGLIKELTEKHTDEQLQDMMPSILGKWKNTYTLTKAMAEEMVKNVEKDLPTVIFRPGIVIGTAEEPIKGWIDNLYGPTGVIVGCGAGLLRVMLLDMKRNSNLIPVDYTINCIIASAWDMHENKSKRKPIYNYISNARNPLNWGDYLNLCFKYGEECPSNKAIWYNYLVCTTNRWLFYFYLIFLHLLPALLMDTALVIQGKKAKMLSVYKKIHKYLEVIAYFSTHEWVFADDNVQALIKNMSDEDKKLFYCNMEDLSWKAYLKDSLQGVRIYLFKEDPSTIPAATERMKKLKFCHRIVQTVVYAVVIYFLYYLISSLF